MLMIRGRAVDIAAAREVRAWTARLSAQARSVLMRTWRSRSARLRRPERSAQDVSNFSRRTYVRGALSGLALPASAVVTGPLLARTLGPSGRGDVAAVLTPLFLLVPVVAVGVSESASFLVGSQRLSRRRALNAGAILALLYGGLGSVVVWFAAPVVLTNFPQLVLLLRLLGLTLPFSVLQVAMRGVSQGSGEFRNVVRERYAGVIGRILILVALAALGVVTVRTASLASVLPTVASMVLLIPIWQAARRDRPVDGLSSVRSAVLLARFGAMSWLGSLAGVLILRLDQVFLATQVSSVELGYYAVAASLAEVPTSAVGTIREIATARMATTGRFETVARTTSTVLGLSALMAAAAVFTTPFLLPLVFGRDFAPAIAMVQILFVAAAIGDPMGVIMGGLTGNGDGLRVSAIQIAGLAVNVGVLVLLVPPLGGVGAALATLASYATTFALALKVVRARSGLPLRAFLSPYQEMATLLRAVRRRRGAENDEFQSASLMTEDACGTAADLRSRRSRPAPVRPSLERPTPDGRPTPVRPTPAGRPSPAERWPPPGTRTSGG